MVEVTASYQITEKAKEHATVHIAFPRIQERWSYLHRLQDCKPVA